MGRSRARSRFGAARLPLKVRPRIPMAGYSVLARRGRYRRNAAPEQRLWVRAFYFRDAEGHELAVAVVDLMGASIYLHERAAAITSASRFRLGPERLVLAGTHTHTAPGHYFGSRVYDHHATNDTWKGFDRRLADGMAASIAEAVIEAASRAVPARLAFPPVERLWGVTRNRSLEAFLQNPEAEHWNEPGMPGETDLRLTAAQRAVDPRVRVVAAYDEAGALLGALATFGAHNTAMGFRTRYYDPDWAGRAAWHAERALEHERGRPVVAVALSGAADVSPLPAVDRETYYGPETQGEELARFVGRRVGNAVIHACNADAPQEDFELRAGCTRWFPSRYFARVGREPEGFPPLSPYRFGVPTLGGAPDGRTALHLVAPEGWPGNRFPPDHPQYPKRPALGPIYRLWQRVRRLELAPYHTLHVFSLNDHWFATVPGEPTTITAWRVERSLLDAFPEARSAGVLGYAGDYAGYFTTPEEYRLQYYEGGSNLYGRFTGEHLRLQLLRLARRVQGGRQREEGGERVEHGEEAA